MSTVGTLWNFISLNDNPDAASVVRSLCTAQANGWLGKTSACFSLVQCEDPERIPKRVTPSQMHSMLRCGIFASQAAIIGPWLRRSLWCCCGWCSSSYSGWHVAMHSGKGALDNYISMQQGSNVLLFNTQLHKCNKPISQIWSWWVQTSQTLNAFPSPGTDAEKDHPCFTCCAGCCRTKAPWTRFKNSQVSSERQRGKISFIGSL